MAEREHYGRWDPHAQKWVPFDPRLEQHVTSRQMRWLNVWVGIIALIMVIWSLVAVGVYIAIGTSRDQRSTNQCQYSYTC